MRGARLSTWVVMLQEVPRLCWYTWTIGNCKAADLELMSLRLGGGQHLFSLSEGGGGGGGDMRFIRSCILLTCAKDDIHTNSLHMQLGVGILGLTSAA